MHLKILHQICIITINISSLPSGRSLATNSSTLLYPPPSSSYSHKTPPSDHQSFQSLVCPSVSFSPFFPPAQVLSTHHLSRLVLFNSPAFSNSSSTSSLLVLSSQLTFSKLLQTHISNASNLSIASFFMTQVSHPYCGPYSATGHTSALTILFLSVLRTLFAA